MPDEPSEAAARPSPAFARNFPRDPGLDALVDAFGRGDYARVRAEAPKLEASTEDEAIRVAARTLVERTNPDPLVVRILMLATLLLVVLAGWWIAHAKAPPTGANGVPPVERVK
jgi:hypothetical protein